jgi:uncharacterized membrane protein
MMGFGCNGMGWGGWGAWGGPGIIGLIVNIVLWGAVLAALIAGIIWLVRRLGRQPQVTDGETPLNLTRQRLAAGEITVGEFDEIVHRLQAKPGPAD